MADTPDRFSARAQASPTSGLPVDAPAHIELFENAFHFAPIGMSLVSLDGRFLKINEAFRRIVGYPQATLLELDFQRITHPDDLEADLGLLAQLLAGEISSYQMDKRYIRADGATVWANLSVSLVFNADGSPKHFISQVQDLTERKAMENDLRAARDAAQAAGEAKADFLANMSHEIRTPLTGIIGFSGLLEEAQGLPELARFYVQRIATSGRALLSVVNDILDFSKLDARQVELDPHPFDPAAFITDTVALQAAQAANKGLGLDVRVDPSVPALIEADSSRLRQVLLNLVTNAVKFTAAGGVSVSVDYDADLALLRVAVADTGQGIAPDKHERLFQRFSQADSAINRTHGGTGLGLAICKSLVDLMGGRIEVQSAEGEGAVFWFTILAPAATAAPVEAIVHEPARGADADAARILLVDDLLVNRELVKAMLAPFGHGFVEADSGAEAVKAALGTRFDLILMDMQMPGMDGLTATRIIRETAALNRETPIIALSANVLAQHLTACAEAGMDDHLAKPIRPGELLLKVARWRAGRQAGAAHAKPARDLQHGERADRLAS